MISNNIHECFVTLEYFLILTMIMKKRNNSKCRKITNDVKGYITDFYQDSTDLDNPYVIDMDQSGDYEMHKIYQPSASKSKKTQDSQGILINSHGCDMSDLVTYLRKIFVSMNRLNFYGFIIAMFGIFIILDIWVSISGEEFLDTILFYGCIILSLGLIINMIKSIFKWKTRINDSICTHTHWSKDMFKYRKLLFAEFCAMCVILYKIGISLVQINVFYRMFRLDTFDDMESESTHVFSLVYIIMLIWIGCDQIINEVRYVIGTMYDVYLLIYQTKICLKIKQNEITKTITPDEIMCYDKCDKLHHNQCDPPDYESHKSLKYKIDFSKKSDYDQRLELDHGVTHCVDCENQIGKTHIRFIHVSRMVDFRRIVLIICCFVLSYQAMHDEHYNIHIFEMIHTMCNVFICSLILHIVTEVMILSYLLTSTLNKTVINPCKVRFFRNKTDCDYQSADNQWAMCVVRFCFSFSNDIILGCFAMFLRDIIDIKIHESSPHCIIWLIGAVIGYVCQISAYNRNEENIKL